VLCCPGSNPSPAHRTPPPPLSCGGSAVKLVGSKRPPQRFRVGRRVSLPLHDTLMTREPDGWRRSAGRRNQAASRVSKSARGAHEVAWRCLAEPESIALALVVAPPRQ